MGLSISPMLKSAHWMILDWPPRALEMAGGLPFPVLCWKHSLLSPPFHGRYLIKIHIKTRLGSSDRLRFFIWPLQKSCFFTLFFNKGGWRVKFTPNSIIPNLGGSYISNLSLQIYLESFKKFLWVVVVGGGWWWWCLNVDLVIGFGPSLDLGTWT